MIKCILIPLGLLVLAAIAIGVFFAAGGVKVPEVVGVRNSWGDVTRESTEIQTEIDVNNPNSFGTRMGRVDLVADVELNDVEVGEGAADDLDLPAGPSTVRFLTVIDNSKIPAWWASHVENDEHTAARIRPTVNVRFIGPAFGVQVPPITREFDTDILAGANSDQPANFGLGPLTLTVVSRHLDWGEVTEETTNLDGRIVLRHNAPVAVPVSRLDFTYAMNGVPVAEVSTEDPIVLQPNTDTPIPYSAQVDNLRLLDWWPTHINADERTEYTITVEVVLDAGILGGQTAPIPVLNFSDNFETNILNQ